MKGIALLLILAILTITLPTTFVELSYGLHGTQLTTDISLQDRPALIFAPAYSGLPNRYYLAYQSWESGEEYGGDIFIEILDLAWNRIKKVRVTDDPSYQDSPCLVYDGSNLYVLYISTEMGLYSIFVQKFDANLNFIYKTPLTESSYPEDRPSAVLLMGEYFYVAYQTWLLGEDYHGDICIEVFDLSWHSIEKVMVTNDAFYEDSPSICHTDEFIYVAYVSNERGYENIFAKRYGLTLENGTNFQLTNDLYFHDMPSLNTIVTETFNGFSLAYQGWPEEATRGDIFVRYFYSDFRFYDNIRITRSQWYEDSPSITSETVDRLAYVAYVSNMTGNWDIFVSPIEEAPYQYMLNINSTAGGTTNPPTGTYIHEGGTVVPVTALPSSGYYFNHWELDGRTDYNVTIQVTMDRNYTLTAVFSKTTYPYDETVVEKIIGIANLTTDVIALRLSRPMHPGDVITPVVNKTGYSYLSTSASNYVTTTSGYKSNGTVWFYWLNDCPYAMFAHKTRYVFIDNATGKYEVMYENWPPALNNEEIWRTPEEYWNPENWVYASTTDFTQPIVTLEGGDSVNLVAESKSSSVTNPENQHSKRALIIEGHNPFGSDFKNASELWYNLMVNFGYTDEEIIYLTPAIRPKTDFLCTKENVTNAIQSLSNTLKSGDNLTIVIVAHGYVQEDNYTGVIFLTNWADQLYDWELKQRLGQIEDGVNMTIVFESCFSGGFMDDLWTLENVKVMITSTDWKSQSYFASAGLDPPAFYNGIKPDMWAWNDTNPWDEGCEFSSGLMERLNELKDAFAANQMTLGDLYVNACKRAKELDAGYRNGDVLKSYYNNESEKKPNPLLNTVFFEGDITHDGTVNILDLGKAAIAFNTKPGDSKWDPEADIQKNRWINIVDITKIAVKFYTKYYQDP